MKKIFFIVLVLIGTKAFSQHYEADVKEDTAATTLTKNNINIFFTLGSFITNGDEHIKDYQPLSFNIGLQYLYKVNKNIGIYSNLSFSSNRFSVIQEPGISFPTSDLNDKNIYTFGGIQAATGFTFMLTHKGCDDDVRTSLTLYGFGEYYYYRELEVSGKLNKSNAPFASTYNTVYHKLSYVVPFNYGVGGEIKIYYIYLGARYFMSNFIDSSFKKDHNWPDFPKLKIYLKYKF